MIFVQNAHSTGHEDMLVLSQSMLGNWGGGADGRGWARVGADDPFHSQKFLFQNSSRFDDQFQVLCRNNSKQQIKYSSVKTFAKIQKS